MKWGILEEIFMKRNVFVSFLVGLLLCSGTINLSAEVVQDDTEVIRADTDFTDYSTTSATIQESVLESGDNENFIV